MDAIVAGVRAEISYIAALANPTYSNRRARDRSIPRTITTHAHQTTSCGRFKRFGYRHCGRCVPCLIRRAAFHAWKVRDQTEYVYEDLSIDDADHARSDDVRAAAMAVAEAADGGIDEWLGAALSSPAMRGSALELRDIAARGLTEIADFLEMFRIK